MAGLLGFTLADLSGAVDSRKRQYANLVRGLLSDPKALMEQLSAQDAEAAQRNRYTQASAGSVMPEVAQQGQQAMMDAVMNLGGLLGITAYHGSPHTFDKFDMSKIGTGEGAQAYGHGLYFAESPQVANEYKKALGGSEYVAGGKVIGKSGALNTPQGYAAGLLDQSAGDATKATALLERFQKQGLNGYTSKTWTDKIRAAIDELSQTGVQKRDAGVTYKVDIPDDAVAKMLDWDKPLSQQPEAVRKAVKTSMDDAGVQSYKSPDGMVYMGVGEEQSLRGSDIYKLLTQQSRDGAIISGRNSETTLSAAQRSAAEYLRALGIPGIRYLDAGSRGKGGTSNFVLFDDQLPKIVGRE